MRGNGDDPRPIFNRDAVADLPLPDLYRRAGRAVFPRVENIGNSLVPAERVDEFAMIIDSFHSTHVACARNPSNRTSIADVGYSIGMESDDLSTEGGRLRWARKRSGYTTAEAAARAVSCSAVSFRAYENNQHGFTKHAVKFARKFGVSVEWLVEGGSIQDAPQAHAQPVNWLPSDETLERCLMAALPGELVGPVSRERLQVAALAVGAAIRLLARHPENEGDPAAMQVIEARIAELISPSMTGKSQLA